MASSNRVGAGVALGLSSTDGRTSPKAAERLKLSLEQKVRLLTGADAWSLASEPALQLRRLVLSDGPAGVRGEHWDERHSSANIPSPTALAATWDPVRVASIGRLLAGECHRKGVHVLLAPTVNLQRSPYGGRHFEMLSEDPLLTAVLGSAYVAGLQSQHVAATVKHFVGNDSETDRYHVDVVVDERTLREVYLAPFEMIIREAGAWAVMAAYNRVNGTTMTESPLLRDVLQAEWGFDGVTMTDWHAGRSTAASANSGLDLMMPGPDGSWGPALVSAVREGQVTEYAVNDKVSRILRLASRVGVIGEDNGGRADDDQTQTDIRGELRSAAAASFVLLRNTGPTVKPGGHPTAALPLDRTELRRIAVLGPNAARGRTLGGGSALVFPPYAISPLEGISRAVEGYAEIEHVAGVRAQRRLAPADPAYLIMPDSELQGVELILTDTHGKQLGTERRQAASFNWHGPIAGVEPHLVKRIRLRTRVRVSQPGHYIVGGSGLGHFTLMVDGQQQFAVHLWLPEDADPAEGLMRPPQKGVGLTWATGQLVDIELSFAPAVPGASFEAAMVAFQLNIEPPHPKDEEAINEAVKAAANADVAILVVGTNEEVESEGFDRDSLQLPGQQDELVRRVAEVNSRTVVVVNSGAPVLLPWRGEVASILLTWFPGQEFGNALADVLFGAAEPGGRLPTTWPAVEDSTLLSTCPVEGKIAYEEGLHIGYRRFLRTEVEPAYWFGHGLGFTSWSYGHPTVEPNEGGGAELLVLVRNTGTRPGREVVQVYASRPDTSIDRPKRWLAGFAAVRADAGEEVEVAVSIRARAFQHWDAAQHRWDTEPGAFELHLARSVENVVSTVTIEPQTLRSSQ